MGEYRIGDVAFPNGTVTQSFASNLSRTATSAAYLFTLPAKSVVKQITVIGAKSNAGTSARISLGSSGTSASGFLDQFNVKANGEVSYPSSFDPTPASAWHTSPIDIYGVYAEDGAASNTGGPWTVVVDVLGVE